MRGGTAFATAGLKTLLDTRISGKLFTRIRNNVAFHYAEKTIDFSNLKNRLDEKSTCLYLAEGGYGGDMLLHLSTLAILDPLLGLANLVPHLLAGPGSLETISFGRMMEADFS
jgi:hypothetical protein